MKQQRAYQYRFYPTTEQVQILAHTFGCCRYVYNWALRERTDAYYTHGERLYYEGTAQRLTLFKKQDETAWLNDVASVPLQQALRHLDRAFRNFFEGHAHYPTFKKKHGANRYFVSILVEEDIKPLPVVTKEIGLDLGLKSMVITSDGHTYGNPKFFAKDEKKLAKAQRRHAKKKKGSKNRN